MPAGYFVYGEREIAHLSRADALLGQAIAAIGPLRRPLEPDLFAALVNCIIGQLISSKAAATASRRLLALCHAVTPANLSRLPAAAIQTCGITMKKATAIHDIAAAVAAGAVDLAALHDLDDEAVITHLTALPGVGRWTAEMMLLHALARPDIVSWGDIAIRRGMRHLYGLASLDKRTFDHYRAAYAPYGSVASIYLWELSRGQYTAD